MKSSFKLALVSAFLFGAASGGPAVAAATFNGMPLNVNPDHIANNDTLTWSLLAVLGVTLGMVTACGMGIYRQFRRATPETELIEEIKRQAHLPGPIHLPPAPTPSSSKSWERPADWWKNPQD